MSVSTDDMYCIVSDWVMCIQSQDDGFVVTQFHLTEWPEHGRPASTGSLVEMLEMITKAQMNLGNCAITVLCKSVQHVHATSPDHKCIVSVSDMCHAVMEWVVLEHSSVCTLSWSD